MSELDTELEAVLGRLHNTNDGLKEDKKKRETKALPKVKVVVGSGEKFFSDVFGFIPTSGIDHAVRVFSPEDWHEDVRCFIPDVDDKYILPQEQTELFTVALQQGDSILTVGPKGSGKTTLSQQVCARCNIPWFRVNHNLDMDSASLYGTPSVSGGTLGWNDGPLPLLARHGGVLCSDEISSTPSGITMSMMAPLERGGFVYVADMPASVGSKYIKPHPWFRICATDNTVLQGDTTGRYAGTNVQNEALVDRFTTTIALNYLTNEHEKAVIWSHAPSLDETVLRRMLSLAGLIRSGYNTNDINVTMSPRGLVNWAQKIVYWGDPQLAFKVSYWNKLTDDDKKKVSELYTKTFAVDLT